MVLSIANPGTPERIAQVMETSELSRSHKDSIIDLANSSKIGVRIQRSASKKID